MERGKGESEKEKDAFSLSLFSFIEITSERERENEKAGRSGASLHVRPIDRTNGIAVFPPNEFTYARMPIVLQIATLDRSSRLDCSDSFACVFALAPRLVSLSLSFIHSHSSVLPDAQIQSSPRAFDVNFINLSGHRDYVSETWLFRTRRVKTHTMSVLHIKVLYRRLCYLFL